MNTQTQNFREYLKEAYRERTGLNPSYSMSAFARDLGFSPAMLTLILKGQRGLSPEAAERVADALRLAGSTKEYFISLVQESHARSPKARLIAKHTLEQYRAQGSARSLELDAFRVISDWYHFAILELLKIPSSIDTPLWIAEQLEIEVDAVVQALERLQKLELLEMRDGKLTPVDDAVFTPEGVPSIALRKYHKQVLQKALRAIEEQEVDERYLNSTFLVVDRDGYDVMKKKINEMHLELMENAQSPKKDSKVYVVSTQFFQVNPEPKTEKQK